MSRDPKCAEIARDLAEPLAGTGIEDAECWLVVEDRSSWGAKAFETADGGLRKAVKTLSKQLGKDVGETRVQAIRRPDRTRLGAEAPVVVYVGHAETRSLRRADVSVDELAELDVVAMARGELGTAVDEPLVLVCMHARRDRCCPRWGAPVYKALDAEIGDHAWHTSHVGGHRFAANLVVLPSGLCYGQVEAADVDGLLTAERAGEVFAPDSRLRGDARYHRAAQSADAWLRTNTGLLERDALRLHGIERGDDGIRIVTFEAHDGRHWRVPVQKTKLEPRLTSCDKDKPKRVKVYRVLEDGAVNV